jgi:hypothetical protein
MFFFFSTPYLLKLVLILFEKYIILMQIYCDRKSNLPVASIGLTLSSIPSTVYIVWVRSETLRPKPPCSEEDAGR